MKKNWWKVLGVIILLYVFTAGLLVPLKTGISDISPQVFKTGQRAELHVTGYNSHYTRAEGQLRAWLKADTEHAIAAIAIDVLDDRQLKIAFEIPKALPNEASMVDCSLIIDSPVDGAHLYPAGIRLMQDSLRLAVDTLAWTLAPLENLHYHRGFTFPYRNILAETIRNTYFHVSLWFAMFILFVAALVYSIRYLRRPASHFDHWAASLTSVGMLFGILGLATGAVWARYTWGAFWSWDVKQNMTAVGLLIYGAYFVLRGAFEDPERRARLSAVYNIFAFSTLIPLLYVIPKLTDSLHPGAGGNIAFGSQDLDNTMRLVFYPSIIGWTLLGLWIAQLVFRKKAIEEKLLQRH